MTVTRVQRHGFSLAAEISGQDAGAPVVVMSTSVGATRDMWEPQVELLASKYRVIRYDTRGHGQSDAPEGPYNFDDLEDDVLALLDYFSVDRADYVGLSLGGMTGLGVGLKAPERIGRLVVAAARADAPPPFASSWDDRIAAIRGGGMEAIWPGTLERWLTEDYRQANPDVVEMLKEGFLATSVTGYEGCARALQGLDYLRKLPEMRPEILYVAGEADMGAPTAAMEAMAKATPKSRFHCLPNSAHIVNLNARGDFDRILRDFLEI